MNAYTVYSGYKTKKSTSLDRHGFIQTIGFGMVAIALGGITRSSLPAIKLEANYLYNRAQEYVASIVMPKKQLPLSVPMAFNPLLDEAGNPIEPADMTFSVIVPKIGINAPVIPSVDPASPAAYSDALLQGVAHAATSMFPDQNGVVYLFSHSTNYDWYVKDLNAVFYLMKNLEAGDLVVLVYKNVRYTYKIREKRVVAPTEISYMAPILGTKTLILETCWPPGQTTERLLVFADLFDTQALGK